MKKFFTALLSMMLLFAFFIPTKVNAATNSSSAGIVNITNGSLNVRSNATTSSTIKATLKKGSYITLISKSGSWWYVEYAKNSYGYCYESYINTVNSTLNKVKISSGSLNVRSGPGSNYSRVASLYKDELVIVLESSGNWSKILYHGSKIGYVSKTYLTTTLTQTTAFPAVNLNVPNFKQTDSRWANVILGSSGKTIAQIGCATTGIAMVESFKTKTTIYPNVMAKKLKYTSSGNVYWPSYFIANTSSTNYLSKIYNSLKNGKCVLLGGKNSYGAQHWVVITGYKGGSTLTASSFTINDPGSNTRTNLQQFLNNYPKFYKYFTY